MRDMAGSCATLSVAKRYNICSTMQEGSDAKTNAGCEETRRPWLAVGPADHGAARPLGPTLVFTDRLGIARAAAHLARLARRLRRGLADRAADAAVGIARGGLRRVGSCGRL